MKEGRVKVVIDDNKRIPFVGKGPIRTPMCLTISQYEVLKKLGFKIKKVGELKHKYNTTNVSELKEKDASEDGVNTNEESHNGNVTMDAETSGADEAFEEESTKEEDDLVDSEDGSGIREDSEDIDEDEETDSDDEVVDDEEVSDEDEEVSEEDEENPDYATDEEEVSSEEKSAGDENDEDNDEEYVDIDSLTKGEIKKRLDELGVSYGKNSNINTLKKLLMENLPE